MLNRALASLLRFLAPLIAAAVLLVACGDGDKTAKTGDGQETARTVVATPTQIAMADGEATRPAVPRLRQDPRKGVFPITLALETGKAWVSISVRRLPASEDSEEASLVFEGFVEAKESHDFAYHFSVSDSTGSSYEGPALLLGSLEKGDKRRFVTPLTLPIEAIVTSFTLSPVSPGPNEITYHFELSARDVPTTPFLPLGYEESE